MSEYSVLKVELRIDGSVVKEIVFLSHWYSGAVFGQG